MKSIAKNNKLFEHRCVSVYLGMAIRRLHVLQNTAWRKPRAREFFFGASLAQAGFTSCSAVDFHWFLGWIMQPPAAKAPSRPAGECIPQQPSHRADQPENAALSSQSAKPTRILSARLRKLRASSRARKACL